MNTLNEYEELKKIGYDGFANYYLQQCDETLSSLTIKDDESDVHIYTKLVEVDSKLGTPAIHQLLRLLNHSLRLDLLKV